MSDINVFRCSNIFVRIYNHQKMRLKPLVSSYLSAEQKFSLVFIKKESFKETRLPCMESNLDAVHLGKDKKIEINRKS